MSTREQAYRIIDGLSEEQLEGLLMLFGSSISETPNAETVEAMQEADRIARDSSVKGFTDIDEMFGEILGE